MEYIVTDDMLDENVVNINQCIRIMRRGYTRENNARDTNTLEIKAMIGILYMAGVMKSSHRVFKKTLCSGQESTRVSSSNYVL